MSTLGTVAEIWRYPVKSMGGERVGHASIGPRGVAGDRGWAVRDETVGEIRSAKRMPALLMCRARYLEEPQGDEIPHVEITLPDESTLCTCDADANARLSTFLEREATLWPLQPATDEAHYRRRDLLDSEDALRTFLSREPGEALPNMSKADPEVIRELTEFSTPRGTYFDVGMLHLITTASLSALGALVPDSQLDVPRFRPNLVVRTEPEQFGFVEFEWSGRSLHLGDFSVTAAGPVVRCGMAAAQLPGLPKDPSILRAIVRDVQQCFGIYAETQMTGIVTEGQEIRLG